MAIPIITIHRGYASYLTLALLQAKITNPESEIILLGDQENQFLDFVRHEPIDRYFEKAQAFEPHYAKKHRSPNPYEYELFCFQRWFILMEFMQAHGIDQCVHLDSDVMLYADLSQEAKKFDAFEFTLSNRGSGHTSFLKMAGLEKLCQLLMQAYTCEATFAEVEEVVRQRDEEKLRRNIPRDRIGGVSDMCLLGLFYRKYTDAIGLTSEIIDGSVYDININVSRGFEMQDGMKHIRWVEGQPVCQHLELGKDIRFNSLHFQGAAKQHMAKYFTGNKAQAFYYKLRGVLERKLKRQLSSV